MLSKETIQEFKEIYKRKEGKELSNKEAFELATNLLLVFDAIYHPVSKKDVGELNKYNPKKQ